MDKRVVLIVLDSMGCGAMEDAWRYGDEGSDTLRHTAEAVEGLKAPNLQRMGLGCLGGIRGVPPVAKPEGAYGKMREQSPGKDTTTGHWEMMGQILSQPFPTFPDGFPPELMAAFEQKIGRGTLGNVVASGTEIIERLGAEHMRSGRPIVYTSADSVFQIAAHEEIIALDELYGMCRTARELLTGKYAVGRVIARPFTGEPGRFTRTAHRHDFSLAPRRLILDELTAAGLPVAAIGKIKDIYDGHGITAHYPSGSNAEGMRQVLAALREQRRGLIFANLVDFDMMFGHRNDAAGYAGAIEDFDAWLPQLMAELKPQDVLLITADHGCDPTTESTDHSREFVPLLAWGRPVRGGVDLQCRDSFADVGQTIADYLGVIPDAGLAGTSFWPQIERGL
ncbi:MAG: phosphopentomutase [Syntrophomonadaceae bacterium]|nr:phosphopentomutase [Syntrophomonadaceae bacterium]